MHADSETHHRGILCFFSTGSQCDLQVLSHLNNQSHEEHLGEYQSVVLLAYPNVYFPRLFAAHEASICNKNPFWFEYELSTYKLNVEIDYFHLQGENSLSNF